MRLLLRVLPKAAGYIGGNGGNGCLLGCDGLRGCGLHRRFGMRHLVAFLMLGQKASDSVVNHVDISLRAFRGQVRAVAIEPGAVRGAQVVPIDDLHVAVTLGSAIERSVRLRHPALRAAGVHEEHVPVSYTHLDVYKRQIR